MNLQLMTMTMYHHPLPLAAAVSSSSSAPFLRRRPPPTRTIFSLSTPPTRTISAVSSVQAPHRDDDEEDDDRYLFALDGEYSDGSPSPWEGALVYRRDAAVSHLEYATTLERLGLQDLSSPDSRVRAAAMGLGPGPGPGPGPDQTPVLVSVDVTRRRGRLRLDGIVRTVITLGCFRCAEAAPEGIFANFSLLLTEEPVEEPDVVDLGTMYEEDDDIANEPCEDDHDIDWDDRLHFLASDREIDISKHIRDIIHLEITLDAVCCPGCKGLCLACGANLNTTTCTCSTTSTRQPTGPLKGLLRPVQKHKVASE